MRKKQQISVIELFSGIGAQAEGIKRTGLFDMTLCATAERNLYSTLSYAGVHCDLTAEDIASYTGYPSREEMVAYLSERGIGYVERKRALCAFNQIPLDELKSYWLAAKVSKNIGDITYIDTLPKADLWTYSFPCQDISRQGKKSGIVAGQTNSGVLSKVVELLQHAVEDETAPKYLILENVPELTTVYKAQFTALLTGLDVLGYNTYWAILNAKKVTTTPQNRERCFAVSIRKDIDKGRFTFPENASTCSLQPLADLMDEVTEQKYILPRHKIPRTVTWDISNACLRKVTPLEYWRLMGFDTEAFNRAANLGVSDAKLRTQAGNSIVVDCFAAIMRELYYAQYATQRELKAYREANKHVDVQNKHEAANSTPDVLNEPVLLLDVAYLTRPARVFNRVSPTLKADRHGLLIQDRRANAVKNARAVLNNQE